MWDVKANIMGTVSTVHLKSNVNIFLLGTVTSYYHDNNKAFHANQIFSYRINADEFQSTEEVQVNGFTASSIEKHIFFFCIYFVF